MADEHRTILDSLNNDKITMQSSDSIVGVSHPSDFVEQELHLLLSDGNGH